MPPDLPSTVRRVVQVTVAAKITAAMAALLPSFAARLAVSVGAAALAVGATHALPARLPIATLAADLSLAVAASTLLQGVLAPGGLALPLSLAHCCMVLEIGQALPLGHLADSFLGNTQFIFAQSVGLLLVAALTPALSFIAACGLAGAALWWASRDTALSTALTQAAIFVLRTTHVPRHPPPRARAPGGGAMSTVKPAGGMGGGGGSGGGGRRRRGGPGKDAPGGPLEGGDRLGAIGEVVQRLPCVAGRVAARPAHQDVGPAVAHLQTQQLLHLVLLPTVRTEDRRWWTGVTTQVVWAAEVGPKALDIELRENTPHCGDVQAVRVGGRAGEDLERAHPPRG